MYPTKIQYQIYILFSSEYLDKEHSSRIRDLETKKRNCIANFKLKNKKEVEELFAKLINILRIIERELDHNLECEASIHFSDSIEHQIEEFNKQSEYLDRFMLRSNYLDQDFFENISVWNYAYLWLSIMW